jgi:hypothetical protein
MALMAYSQDFENIFLLLSGKNNKNNKIKRVFYLFIKIIFLTFHYLDKWGSFNQPE